MLGKISVLAAFFAAGAIPVFADGGAPGAYLRHDVGARAAGLAGAYGALADDGTSLRWNPAGLARIPKPELSATHVILYEDISMDLGVGAMPIRDWGVFAVGYLRQSTGGFEKRATPLDAPMSFSITQTAMLAGWGRSFNFLPFPFRAGAALKQVRETIDTVGASSWGADLGFGVEPVSRLSVGLLAQNFAAPRLRFVSTPVDYPKMLDASAAYQWGSPRSWNATTVLRVAEVWDEGKRIAGGVEFWQDRTAALRLGSDGDGWSTGVGVRLGNLHIDYAARLAELGTQHQVTLRMQFGQTKEELEELIRAGVQKVTKEEAQRLAKAYVKTAEQDLAENNYVKAVSNYEAAALWDPSDPNIATRLQDVLGQVEATVRRQIVERTTLLADQQFQRGNWIASQAQFKNVLDADPNDAHARDMLAKIEQLFAERAQKEQAERDSQRARVERARKEALDFVRAGEDALKRGRFREAAEQALSAFKAMPGMKEAEELRARVALGRVKTIEAKLAEGEGFLAAKQPEKARAAFAWVVAEDPKNALAHEKLAQLNEAARAPLTDEQRKQIEKTYYLAVDSYLKSRYDEAGKHLDEIFKIDPNDENARKLKDKVDAALKLR
ncbi:MAG: hypothetical protein HY925_09900 [Elusimicrobia bacterium]|nr:hypothetical protein [Elusimicrobiota bacterium]